MVISLMISEYIRDLVRKDQQENRKLLELKTAIDVGLQSGKSHENCGYY